jgi:hypothetical protein
VTEGTGLVIELTDEQKQAFRVRIPLTSEQKESLSARFGREVEAIEVDTRMATSDTGVAEFNLEYREPSIVFREPEVTIEPGSLVYW